MTRFLAATVSALAILAAAAPANATLQIEVFDNGALVADATGITIGAATITADNDPNFANITHQRSRLADLAEGGPIERYP